MELLREYKLVGNDESNLSAFKKAIRPDADMFAEIIKQLKMYKDNLNEDSVQIFDDESQIKNNKEFKKMCFSFSAVLQTEKPVMIPVIPIGFKLNCHRNSAYGAEFLNELSQTNDWERRSGYIFFFCKCSKKINAEVHSVIYHRPTQTYIDITPDPIDNNIKKKIFMDCNLANKIGFLQSISPRLFYVYNLPCCRRCKIYDKQTDNMSHHTDLKKILTGIFKS